MVKRRFYRFLSIMAISAMMATSVTPNTVYATEVKDSATEDSVDEKQASLQETEEPQESTSEGEDAKKDSDRDSKDSQEDDKSKKYLEDSEDSKDQKAEDAKEDAKESKSDDAKEDVLEDTSEEADEESDETCKITYSMYDFDQSYEGGSWGTDVTLKNGVCVIDYSGNYAEKVFGLPKGIKGSKVKSVQVNIKSGDVRGFSVKFRDAGTELKADYGTNVLENTEAVDFDGIGLMNCSGDATSFTIRSITLTLKGSAEDYPEPTEVEELEEKSEIEWDIPDLKDYISSEDGIGKDAYTGAAIMASEITDDTLMDLVEKHFNAVTFGNELKPDALFNYQNDRPSDGMITTETWTDAKGNKHEDMKVPKLDFSRAEKMLKTIKEWNDEHPESQLKVRGHVLTWHSQTPAWFFKENYDPNGEFVSPEEMSLRHEWFIKSVYEHVFSSQYKDMFYGWDIVNEACSDGTGTYRSASENSNWARIYGTGSKEDAPEYILNAFRFANFYAHKMGKDDLELYYNDYNECSGNKPDAISALLQSVKNHEKDSVLPTRITGFGMQGHHSVASPTKQQIIDCGTRYGKIVGKIQCTELDLKASPEYDGTNATLKAEYTKQAYKYKDIYDAYRELDSIDGIDVNNITFWGVIDPNSWLQTSNSVGGGADGRQKQVPLLFDGDYKAKPSYWAFVDADKLEPFINNITALQVKDDFKADSSLRRKVDYNFTGSEGDGFSVLWNNDKLYVYVETLDEQSQVKVYIDWNSKMEDGAEVQVVEATVDAATGCNLIEIQPPKNLGPGAAFAMDVVCTNSKGTHAFNDRSGSQDTSSKYFAKVICKPTTNIRKGTPVVDGQVDKIWDNVTEIPLEIRGSNAKAQAKAKLLWDESKLYVLMDVKDENLDATAEAAHEKDSIEVFIDENNNKTDSYQEDDKQYRINYLNETSFNGTKCLEENVEHQVTLTDGGYMVEAAFAWTDIQPQEGAVIGLDLQVNDGQAGSRIGTLTWYDETGNGWSSPRVFGEVTLAGEAGQPEEEIDCNKHASIYRAFFPNRNAKWDWASDTVEINLNYKVVDHEGEVYFGAKKNDVVTLTPGKDYDVTMIANVKLLGRGLVRIQGKNFFHGVRYEIVRTR